MSYLAVGSVTQSIAALLLSKLNKPPLMGTTATFRVTTLPPDDSRVDEATGLNVALYRIQENPSSKNMPWRGTRDNPVGSSRTPLSLVLSYLVTAYVQKTANSTQDDITTHQILGNAMAILHDYPVLNDVHDSDFDANVDSQFPAELRNAFDKIKVAILPTTMEEFAHIWTGFGKAYRLSVAYQVSLVEIGPTTPLSLGAPIVQSTAVGAATFSGPQIASITPKSGASGSVITILGHNLKQAGATTAVSVGADDFTEDMLVSISPTQIQLDIPAAPQSGPALPIVVSCAGRESAPVTFTVTPWITSLIPLRGITGIPVKIPLQIPSGAAVAVDVDGNAATITVDPQGKFVSAVIPTAITTNGSHPVVVTLNGQPSNARLFEVLPLITAVNIQTTATPVTTTVTITGERLNGQDVSIVIGGLALRMPAANANATTATVTVNRSLTDTTPVSVLVDGIASNSIPPTLDSVFPASAFMGDTVTLNGNSLSGRNVIVNFAAVAVNVGAQPFSSRMQVTVPAGLAVGATTVSVSVDGRATGTVPMQVAG